jgi:hypothetical protein
MERVVNFDVLKTGDRAVFRLGPDRLEIECTVLGDALAEQVPARPLRSRDFQPLVAASGGWPPDAWHAEGYFLLTPSEYVYTLCPDPDFMEWWENVDHLSVEFARPAAVDAWEAGKKHALDPNDRPLVDQLALAVLGGDDVALGPLLDLLEEQGRLDAAVAARLGQLNKIAAQAVDLVRSYRTGRGALDEDIARLQGALVEAGLLAEREER